jgi:hypothetical protein
LNIIETKRRNQNFFNFGDRENTHEFAQSKITREKSFVEKRRKHNLLDVPSSNSYFSLNKNESYGSSKLCRIQSNIQKPKNLLEFLYVRTNSAQPKVKTKSPKKSKMLFERLSSCPKTTNSEIMLSECKLDKISNFGSSKKQVRFADTAGEGPLYQIFREKISKKKKKDSSKSRFYKLNLFSKERSFQKERKEE